MILNGRFKCFLTIIPPGDGDKNLYTNGARWYNFFSVFSVIGAFGAQPVDSL
jgi:hypothetical protein